MSWRKQKQRAKRARSSSPDTPTHLVAIHTGSSTFDVPVDGAIERVSADTRRTFSEAVAIAPPSPLKRLRKAIAAPSISSNLDISLDAYCMGSGENDWTEEPTEEVTSRKCLEFCDLRTPLYANG
ncbi:hypothetical protein MIND_00972300 [Mycena indigotica]|uniref:Uncharacterized protein n=1 Tax=Mycena indigotica TaxID=2126181 RepID=A0A8H6SDD2_9AGAR|nr:uncharacterized protein MIND_00972300 [Mycena indigotica]KAF7297388.1 hypothetical protein MIND_00972300 [Mycena indigotica]